MDFRPELAGVPAPAVGAGVRAGVVRSRWPAQASLRDRGRRWDRRVLPWLLALGLSLSACAHRGPDGVRTAITMATAGTALAVGGGVTWALADRHDAPAVMVPGVVAVAAGVVAVVAAGILMAGAVACEADADCPHGQSCRETPAGPGRAPYAQCVGR